MVTTIFIADFFKKTSEKEQTFHGTLEEVKQRLIELEEGYCEDGEKPTLVQDGAMTSALLDAVDFFYFANTKYPDIIEPTDELPTNFTITGINLAKAGKYNYSWMSKNKLDGIAGWVKQK